MTTMNYILQSKKKNSFIQLLEGIFNFYRFESKTLSGKLMEVSLKTLSTFLFVLAASGILKLVFELITNPSLFNTASFGVFDHLY